MSNTLQAVTPARPDQRDSEAPVMPAHALTSPTLPPTGYLKVGSVVPWTAPILTFNEDGTVAGLAPEPTLIPDEVAAWAKKELAHLPSRKPIPWPGPKSGNCATRWDAEYGLSWICTLPKHSDDVRCEAQAPKGAVLASPTEKLTTEALRPARKRTVRGAAVA